MKQRDLKAGDKVYIREDLMNGATYGNFVYIDSNKARTSRNIRKVHKYK